MSEQRLVQGNEACAYGALYAGCDFFAGYPITPSSEVMEILSRELPSRGGTFIQLEDELASIAAITGASWAGAKAMTATSGPGFSLMQEGLGYASMTETPCVIVDSQRWGPSTGQPTKTAQGDVMQAIWGAHGDHAVIVLTAATVRDAFELTVEAFNLSETHRVPVVLLLDEVLSHMRENIRWPEPGELAVANRKRPERVADFVPFGGETFLPFGEGARYSVTGMAHDARGFPAGGEPAGRELVRMVDKLEARISEIARYGAHHLDDCEALIVSYGITTRAAESAVRSLRAEGARIGLLDLKTLWPFPGYLLEGIAPQLGYVLVPELNLGQLVREVERSVHRGAAGVRVEGLNQVDGHLLPPVRIVERVRQALAVPQGARGRGT